MEYDLEGFDYFGTTIGNRYENDNDDKYANNIIFQDIKDILILENKDINVYNIKLNSDIINEYIQNEKYKELRKMLYTHFNNNDIHIIINCFNNVTYNSKLQTKLELDSDTLYILIKIGKKNNNFGKGNFKGTDYNDLGYYNIGKGYSKGNYNNTKGNLKGIYNFDKGNPKGKSKGKDNSNYKNIYTNLTVDYQGVIKDIFYFYKNDMNRVLNSIAVSLAEYLKDNSKEIFVIGYKFQDVSIISNIVSNYSFVEEIKKQLHENFNLKKKVGYIIKTHTSTDFAQKTNKSETDFDPFCLYIIVSIKDYNE